MGTWFSCFGAPAPPRRRRRKNAYSSRDMGSSGGDLSPSPMDLHLFSYNELKSATTNFHPTNKIGRGGFGIVYKGILKDNTQVAIKSLSNNSKQGTNELLTEIGMICNIRHPNLVRLIGCCIEGNNRMLVYEYLENNSLANALLAKCIMAGPKHKQIALDWPKRVTICLGTARGLSFLHEETEPHIVHRDIKASNILLDKDLFPKIGDFGLAKLFPDNVTHISTRVAGTMGYLAPEYALLGQLTKKADIYSFGVLVLEIISGKSSSFSLQEHDMKVLLEWTWELREEDRLLDIVDPKLKEYPEEEVLRFIKVALFCTQSIAQQRPSMKEVVEMLLSEEISLDVKSLRQPGTIYEKRSSGDRGSSSGSTQAHKGSPNASINTSITTKKININSSLMSTIEMQPR